MKEHPRSESMMRAEARAALERASYFLGALKARAETAKQRGPRAGLYRTAVAELQTMIARLPSAIGDGCHECGQPVGVTHLPDCTIAYATLRTMGVTDPDVRLLVQGIDAEELFRVRKKTTNSGGAG